MILLHLYEDVEDTGRKETFVSNGTDTNDIIRSVCLPTETLEEYKKQGARWSEEYQMWYIN